MTATRNPFADVRQAIVLSAYVEATYGSKLRSAGQGKFVTACPVHGGDNPSAFTIDDTKGLWHCFSQCGRGGDVFSLWEATNNSTSKRDALVALASVAGVALPEKDRVTDRKTLYSAVRKAADLFHNALVSNSPTIGDATGADEAYRWITDERGMSDEDLDFAHVGFVPDSHSLRSTLEDLVAPRRVLIEAGILAESASGGVYCPFAGRIVFPIRDDRDRVVGFGARAVPEVTRFMEPKFVNTRQTVLYDKSNVLYGIEYVSDDVTRVIVCEGYLDAIAVNALDKPSLVGVASCGTSVTSSHVNLLLDLLPANATVTFMMDGDDAGKKSLGRLAWAAELLGDRGFGILLDSADGKDPWERYCNGTLEDDLEAKWQRPLVFAALRAQMDVAETPEDFDKAVAEHISSASSRFADDILRAAASIRGQSVGDYGEVARRNELADRGRRRHGVVEAPLSLSVRMLVARLLQMPPIEMRAVSGVLEQWDEHTQGFIERWLSAERGNDVDALGYVLFPRDAEFPDEVVQAVSACMSSSEEVESIEPLLRSLSRAILAHAGRVARDTPQTVLDRIRAVRGLATADIPVGSEMECLCLLLDIALELEDVDA